MTTIRKLQLRGHALSIGQVSRTLRLHVASVARWCDLGWLKVAYTADNGHRYFDSADIRELNRINGLWQIATDIRPGTLECDDVIELRAIALSVKKKLKGKQRVSLFELANDLKVTPRTIYMWGHRHITITNQQVAVDTLRAFLNQTIQACSRP